MSSLAKKIAKLEWARAVVAQLSREIAADLNLGINPGSKRTVGPIAAARQAAGELDLDKLGDDDESGTEPKRKSKGGKRTEITPEVRARIRADLAVPDANKAEIARRHGISESVVFRMKQEEEYRNGTRVPQNLDVIRAVAKSMNDPRPASIKAKELRLSTVMYWSHGTMIRSGVYDKFLGADTYNGLSATAPALAPKPEAGSTAQLPGEDKTTWAIRLGKTTTLGIKEISRITNVNRKKVGDLFKGMGRAKPATLQDELTPKITALLKEGKKPYEIIKSLGITESTYYRVVNRVKGEKRK